MNFLTETLLLGLRNLMLHKLRSILTVLGIIIGVAAVVSIAAYGEGAKQAALADIRQLGANNIILRSVKPPSLQNPSGSRRGRLKYGLERRDLRRIRGTIGGLERVTQLKQVGFDVRHGVHGSSAAVMGATTELLDAASLRVARGRYLTEQDRVDQANVVVLGAEVARNLYPLQDPLNKTLKVDHQSFVVVGVLEPIGLAGGAGASLVGRDLNFDVHMPLSTATARFGDLLVRRASGTFEMTELELSELILRVKPEVDVLLVARQLERLIELEHSGKNDVTMVVPLELIRQAERTQVLFSVLMIIIASLSLLVGGIGIMNIMLASVTERTREIGIRRALGATRRHIVAQFLVETTVLSCLGGVLGVGVGLAGVAGIAVAHTYYDMIEKPQITTWSIVVSFTVAAVVGIVFGLYPAVQASRQDPIVALRHD